MKEHKGIEGAIENYNGSTLDLSNQSISSDHLETYWPDIIALEPSIISLNLSGNKINYIGFMSGLPKLTNLNFSNNFVEDLNSSSPSNKIFDGFKSLEILNFSDNNFFFFD
jgi:Leucine-rich repeat (LRR) protein